ncbi:MAG TPA: hypothetical protein G4N95_00815 [Anaerolineae bacterium]|nr:hypothetical protein [Anaerolineae bacterium]
MKTSKHYQYFIITALFIFSLLSSSCSPRLESERITEPPASTEKPLASPIVSIHTFTPTATHTPTQTVSPSPTFTPVPTHTTTPSATPSHTPTDTLTPTMSGYIPSNSIFIYFIHPNTGGPVGCGDSLVPLTIGHTRSDDVIQDLTIALNALFSAGQYSGALINVTYISNLHVDNIDFDKYSGVAGIYMSGSFTKPDNNCDKSRYRAQVWSTAKQFPEVKRAVIFVGNKLLGDLLVASSKDK